MFHSTIEPSNKDVKIFVKLSERQTHLVHPKVDFGVSFSPQTLGG
jgi:hypothetical protein